MAEYAGLDCLDTAEGETKGEGTTEEEFEPDKSRLRKFRDSAMDALHNWDKLRFQAARHRGTRLSPGVLTQTVRTSALRATVRYPA